MNNEWDEWESYSALHAQLLCRLSPEAGLNQVLDMGEIRMEQKKKVQVRTRFIAWLSLILLLPFCVIVVNLQYTGGYRGAVSLLLFMGPFVYICLQCFLTQKPEFSALITLSERRIIYVVCFIMALYLGAVWGWQYSFGPAIAYRDSDFICGSKSVS